MVTPAVGAAVVPAVPGRLAQLEHETVTTIPVGLIPADKVERSTGVVVVPALTPGVTVVRGFGITLKV